MPRSPITTFLSLAVRYTGKFRVSVIRALNTRAIWLGTLSYTSQQHAPEYASKSSAYARLRSGLETGAETPGQAFHTLSSLGFTAVLEECEKAILLNIENAKTCNDEEYAIEQKEKAFQLVAAMISEDRFLVEGVYGPLLNFLIDMKMAEGFYMIFDMIRDGQGIDHSSPEFARLGYYEMHLWIQLKDEENIEESCTMIIKSFKEYPSPNRCLLTENYMLALCEKDPA